MDITGKSGVVENFINIEIMSNWKDIFTKLDKQDFIQTRNIIDNKKNNDKIGYSYGIDKNYSMAILWFEKQVLDRVRKYFDPDLKIIYAHWCNSTKPIQIHADHFPERIPESGQTYISFLIPYSVDNDINLCNNASTIALSEPGTITDFDYEQYLSHCDLNIKDKFKIDHVYRWKCGDLIWWDSTIYHCSGNFLKTNSSKQSIVGHTYI